MKPTSPSSTPIAPVNTPNDRMKRVRVVLDDCIRRRANGELLTDQSLTAAHPDLLPELAEELRKLLLIERARQTSQQPQQHFSVSPPQAEPIRTVAHFEIVERLGTGGFGMVWTARDTRLDRMVALKVPRYGQLAADQVEDFLHEARVAAQLKHPNIVSVHEIGRDGDLVYIVSDLIQGAPLSEWRRDLPLTFDETAALIAAVASALHYAHEQGVVHRDLKPANILIDLQGQPHLTDFGLAKWEADEVVTLDGHILGTPGYMSPEQARGDSRRCDRRTDVYSLGVVLFELLTGELPFRGQPAMQIQQVINDEPPSPRKLNSSVPPDLETVCLKCLEKDPEQRYSTAQAVADELRRFQKGEPILARPVSRSERLVRWCRQHRVASFLLASVIFVMVFTFGWGWYEFDEAYTTLDTQLTAGALTSDAFAAALVAEAAGRDLEDHYDFVEQAARERPLVRLLDELASDPQLLPLLGKLNDPQQDAVVQESRRSALRAHPKLRELQDWLVQQPSDQAAPVFAWFLLDAAGLQLVRHPIEDAQTIGRNYAWRSYFHNASTDQQDNWRPRPEQRLHTTKLSPVFVSQFTDQWVVVVSTPIMDGDRFLGVIGLMIELGKFVELPGNEVGRPAGSDDSRFAVLVDARKTNRGRILQHPSFNVLDGPARRELLDRSQDEDHAVDLVNGWDIHGDYDLTTHTNFCDPLAEISQNAERWLAAQKPVQVRGQPTGLVVIVQEPYGNLIGGPLGTLKTGVRGIGSVFLVFTLFLVFLLCRLVIRLLR